jgi:hypothetical protein
MKLESLKLTNFRIAGERQSDEIPAYRANASNLWRVSFGCT